jgi:hypothetical protein
LPDARVYKAPLADLPDIAHRWLAGEELPRPPRREYNSPPPDPPQNLGEPPEWLL